MDGSRGGKTAPVGAPAVRDLRLDFFRGLALIFIFLNHIPHNVVSWVSSRNWGFSDATEIFVFISGYAVVVAYGPAMRRQGFLVATAQILRRAWQIYLAHIVLFVAYSAQIAYVATRFDNPMFSEEANLADFLNEPHVNLLQALLLKFRPVNMDVLPLYIVLLAAFPPLLWLLLRRPWPVLAASVALYVVCGQGSINLPGHQPGQVWFFNPLCWQLLFVLGALCAQRDDVMGRLRRLDRILLPACGLYLAFALFIVFTWYDERLAVAVPDALQRALYPIDKTNLDVLRLAHFLAAAYLVLRLIGERPAWLAGRLARPLVLCGQHSLHIFCFGVFLSFTGHFVLQQVDDSIAMQIAVSAAGVATMVLLAWLLSWYKSIEASDAARRARASAPPERSAYR